MYDEDYEPVNGYGFRGTIQGTAVVCHCGCETTMKGIQYHQNSTAVYFSVSNALLKGGFGINLPFETERLFVLMKNTVCAQSLNRRRCPSLI